MGAREKLNVFVTLACLVVSALLGLVLDSSAAFWTTLIVTMGGCYVARGIRTPPDARSAKGARGGGGARRPNRGRRP